MYYNNNYQSPYMQQQYGQQQYGQQTYQQPQQQSNYIPYVYVNGIEGVK